MFQTSDFATDVCNRQVPLGHEPVDVVVSILRLRYRNLQQWTDVQKWYGYFEFQFSDFGSKVCNCTFAEIKITDKTFQSSDLATASSGVSSARLKASSGICGNALPPSGLSLAWARHRRAHRLEHGLHGFLSAQAASPFERAPGVKVERQRERRE